MPEAFLLNDAARTGFLAAFEGCELPKAQWTHAAHIMMATIYLRHHGDASLSRSRENIRRYNASVGGPPTAYNETITIFWLAVVDNFLRPQPGLTDHEAVLATNTAFSGARKLHLDYYSVDPLQNVAARTKWLAPDRKPLHVSFRTS